MKKLLILFLALLLAAALLVGCGETERETVGTETHSDEATEDPTVVYELPADVSELDLSAEDPTNEVMRFTYDDDGRVSGCMYEVEGHQIAIVYTYNDDADTVQLTAFSDDLVAALEEYDLPGAYDASLGFSVHNGYYFRGYGFQK